MSIFLLPVSSGQFHKSRGWPLYTGSTVFQDYSILFTSNNTDELTCNWMGTSGFKVKIENERFMVSSSRCRQTLNVLRLHVVVLWNTANKGKKKSNNIVPLKTVILAALSGSVKL